MSRRPAKLDVRKKRKESDPSSDSSPTQSPANDKPPPMSLNEKIFAARCLAHEFFTRGTLDGRPFKPESGSDPGAFMPESPAHAEDSILKADAAAPQASSTPPSSPAGSGCE